MSASGPERYDVVIAGAGPVGSLCALAHARAGARVALLEAAPGASKRLAGEWLHPPAVRTLKDFGIGVDAGPVGNTCKGFVVFPDDASEQIVLPYPAGALGLACSHRWLVSQLHGAVEDEASIDFKLHARVQAVEDGRVTYEQGGVVNSLSSARIVGADGRRSIVRQSLGLSTTPPVCSQMLGVMLEGVTIPLEGYGHVFCGGPGPMLVYRVAERSVRILVDVPATCPTNGDWSGFVSAEYSHLLPENLRDAFRGALLQKRFHAAGNGLLLRTTYGTSRRTLIGDAAGYYHPLTAVGMTLGFGDAVCLAEVVDFHEFTAERIRTTRASELLAMGLYEVFADPGAETAAVLQAIYRRWRLKLSIRQQTVRLLGCEDTSTISLSYSCLATLVRAVTRTIRQSFTERDWRPGCSTLHGLSVRLVWLLRGIWQLRGAPIANEERGERIRRTMARAFRVSMPSRTRDRGN